MSPHPFALLVLALAAGLDGAMTIPRGDLTLRVTAGAEEVEPGEAFPLTVVRTWSKDLVPEEWDDRLLSPLVVRLVETTRREKDGHIEETRRYQCHAFSLEDVTVPAPSFQARPRDGGPARVVTGEAIRLRIRPALDPEAPGPAELPGGLLPRPFPWMLWSVRAAAVLAALALLWWYLWRRLRRPPPAPAPPPPPEPHARALERLERLREREPRGVEEIDAYYVEASAVVREYLEERFALRAPEMTTDQLLAAPETGRLLRARHLALLSELLAQCDLVKFARLRPAARDRERHLATAERFLRETRNGETAEGARPAGSARE